MTIKAIDYETMVKTIASFLDAKSGISPKRLLNRDSIRGADLAEMLNPSQSYSPKASDAFALFEFIENQEDDFITSGEKSTEMNTIQTYDLHLLIYGNPSPAAAQQISAAFKRPENAMALRNEGIFVKGVAPIEPMSEFVNNTWLLRRDLVIRLQVRFAFDDPDQDPGIFDESQTVSTIVLNA